MKVAHDPYVSVMEKALFLWMEGCKHKEILCTMLVLMSKACHIYSELLNKAEVQDRSKFTFSASCGWLEKQVGCVCGGEAATATKEAAKAYVEQLHTLVEEGSYTPN